VCTNDVTYLSPVPTNVCPLELHDDTKVGLNLNSKVQRPYQLPNFRAPLKG
jgi:hypothetical protein